LFLSITRSPHSSSLPAGDKVVEIKSVVSARRIGDQILTDKEPEEILHSAVWEHDPKVRKLICLLAGANPQTKALERMVIPDDQRVKK